MSKTSTDDIDQYLLEDETVSYSVSARPKGLNNLIRSSVFGAGITKLYLTNHRVIEYKSTSVGFEYIDIPINKITSVDYSRQINLPLILLGVLITLVGIIIEGGLQAVLFLVGIALLLYAYLKARQQLAIHSENSDVSLVLPEMEGNKEVDKLIWHINAEIENTVND